MQWPTALTAGLLHGFHACLADEFERVRLVAERAFARRLHLLDFLASDLANG